jgi:hypothetical protein
VELELSRNREWRPFTLPLLTLLFGGPLCHTESGFPVEELARDGLLVGAQGFLGHSSAPVMTMRVHDPAVVQVTDQDFAPPSDFKKRAPLVWGGRTRQETGQVAPPTPLRLTYREATSVARGEAQVRFSEDLTPQCGPETRDADIALSIHQDLLDNLHNAVNMAGSLLGTAFLADGTITVPWLLNLQTIAAASATAPGSGLFKLLVDSPRVPATTTTPASGGTGLLDLLAVMLQRNNPAFNAAPVRAQIGIVDAFEQGELGVISIPGLTTTLGTGSNPWKGLVDVNVSNITGMADFSTLPSFPGGMITSASIGPSGDIQLGLMLPSIGLQGVLNCSLTPSGAATVGAVSVGMCLIAPWTCPAVILIATVLFIILDQITLIDVATSPNVGLAVDIQYQWNPAKSLLSPVVKMTATSGSIAVVSTFSTGGPVASFIDNFFLVVGDLFNTWLTALVEVLPGILQSALTKHASFPPRAGGLTASSGSAASVPGSVLTLQASVNPVAQLPAAPYVTQVDVLTNVAANLPNDLVLLRNSVNPQPLAGAPGPGVGIVLSDATYLAVAASQNLLNYYIFQQWLARDFNITITDPATINAIMRSYPPVFGPMPPPGTITVWPATPPRVEVSMESIVAKQRPLTGFFDDVRACFGFGIDKDGSESPRIEFSFNFKTGATVNLAWPAVFRLGLDRAGIPSEVQAFDLVVFGNPLLMTRIPLVGLQALASKLADQLVAPFPAPAITAAGNVAHWPRPMPGVQEEMLPPVTVLENLQLDILSQRRILYCFPELTSSLLELLDGSGGQPLLGGVLGTTAPVNLATITAAQGVTLRTLVDQFFAAQDFIPPN